MTGNIKPRLAPEVALEVLFLLQDQISKSGAVPRPNKGFGKSSVQMTGKKIDRDSHRVVLFPAQAGPTTPTGIAIRVSSENLQKSPPFFQFSNEIIINAKLFPLLSNSF